MLEQLRAALVAKLRSIADMGVVHDYQRYARTESEFRRLYQAREGDSIKGWFVRRAAQQRGELFIGRDAVKVHWEIQGFMSLEDGAVSEKAFDALIESIFDAFAADKTLGDLCELVSDGDGNVVDLVDSGPVVFAGVLCHAAQIKVTTSYFV